MNWARSWKNGCSGPGSRQSWGSGRRRLPARRAGLAAVPRAADGDELGGLQFQGLCTAVVERDTGVGEEAWRGAADRHRAAALPKSAFADLPPPVLASVVWLRPRLSSESRRAALLDSLDGLRRRVREYSAASVLVMSNAGDQLDRDT